MISGRASVGADPLDDAVEGRRPDHLAERELDVEGREIILERDQLLAARRLVDAVHDRRLLRLQRLGRGDIGGDHIILDQPVRVEPLARRDRQDPALLVEHRPGVRAGRARAARACCAPRAAPASRPRAASAPCRPARSAPAFERRHRAGRGGDFDPLLARRIDRRLCILICNVCGDANLGARESPAFERAVLADMQVAGQRGAVLALLQRADVGRQLLAAASARRGRGNRRCCRAPAPRGRARCRGGRRS